MKSHLRNPWFLLASGFLIINLYGVLRIGRHHPQPPPNPQPIEAEPVAVVAHPITLRGISQVDMEEDERIILALNFDRLVSPHVLQRFISITGADGDALETEVRDSGPDQRLFVAVAAKPSDSLSIRVAKGFHAESGPERLERDIVGGIVLHPDISLTSLNVRAPAFDPPVIMLSFYRPVNITSLRQSLSLEPAGAFVITEHRSWQYGRIYHVTGNLQHNRNYTIRIAPGLRAEASNIRMQTHIEQAVFIPEASAAIRIPVEGRFLSPQGNMLLPLQSINITNFVVKAARLPAHNLVQFAMREGQHYNHHWGNPADHITIPETEYSYTLDAPANSNIYHQISLRDVLPADTTNGAWHIRVDAGKQSQDQRLLVISDIGITVRHAPQEMLVWANSIHTLAPIAHASVQVWSQAGEQILAATTDSQGLARITFEGEKLQPFMITVQTEHDLAFLSIRDSLITQPNQTARRPYLSSISGTATTSSRPLEAFLYTDRGVYRPGENTHARAIVRASHLGLPDQLPVVLHAIRPDGREHSRTPAMLSAYGTADFTMAWADFDATGRYRLEVRTPGATEPIGTTSIALEDFVPPRMAVTVNAQFDPAAPWATAALEARYLYGAPASNNRFQLSLHAVPADFAPPTFPNYAFGDSDRSRQTTTHQIGAGNLDPDGLASTTFRLPDQIKPPAMIEAIITATVHEQGGRTVSAASRGPLHVYPYYIGIHKPDLRNLTPGKYARVAIQLVDPLGEAHKASTPMTVTLEQVQWSTVLVRDSQGRYRYESNESATPLRTEVIVSDHQGSAHFTFLPSITGSLRLRVASADGISTTYAFHVGRDGWQNRAMDRPDRVELKWDRDHYSPGDTAVLTVIAPFPGRALLAVEQDSLLFHDTRLMEGNTTSFHIPVTEAFFPNAHASVHVIRALPPGAASASRQAARAVGSIPLELDPAPHRLQISMDSPRTSRPTSPLPISLQVRNPDGTPAKAEIAIAVIDEAICMLTDFRTPDPIAHFMAVRQLPFQISDLYAMLLPQIDPETALYHAHTGGDIASLLRGRLNPVRSRRFRPLALWQSTIQTDAQGHATVQFEMPEFSGQVRIMAVAVSDARSGSAQQSVTINRPFTVLASLPRFLATGDATRMPIELHHTGNTTIPATLAISTEGPIALDGPSSYDFEIPAGQRPTIDIPLLAANKMGLARILITVTTPDDVITDRIELPIRPPATFRTRHIDIALAPGESTEVAPSNEWIAGTASQTIRVSSIPAIGLSGAFDYLTQYPYGCLEQTLSAGFAVLRLIELPALQTAGLTITDPAAHTRNTINHIFSMQTSNGAFGWWPHATTPYDWGSIYAMHYLSVARLAGFSPPSGPYNNGLQYLRSILARPAPSTLPAAAQTWREDATTRAYACYVLALADTPNHSWTERLREQVENMEIEGRLYLVLALAAGGRRRDARELLQSITNIPLPQKASDSGTLASPARAQALRLYAWLTIDPDDPRIPALVENLLAHQQHGRWRTTHENAAAFLALTQHLILNRNTPQDFAGSVIQADSQTALAPESGTLTLDARAPAVINNQGPGRLYATIQQRGIPSNATRTVDNKLSIRRRYFNINQQAADDTSVQQGDLIIIRLQVDTLGEKRDNLVIEDLLPAGFEIENANLATAEIVPWAKQHTNLPIRHVDIRDDRIIIFTEAFAGIRQFHYAVRAVTPGTYTRPPVTIEGMYTPERHSSHHAGTLTITTP
ncbi:MAG: alpha-2-macroglobulin family protein [Kiritimatiellia bacterium]